MAQVRIIGAGLAGCEAAWQLARRGITVDLYEMKPDQKTPAHTLDTFAELVCSNSLRSDRLENAVGLLKAEMRLLDSLIMTCADQTKIPAGGALAVDREGFSALVSKRIKAHPHIRIIHEEITSLDPADHIPTIVASGPLTSAPLSAAIGELVGSEQLYFFDAVAPTVLADSIDMERAFFANRYEPAGTDYINCPMNKEEYLHFYQELIHARSAPLHEQDQDLKVFEGCMPVEVMAARGEDALRYGPLKPVGLSDARTEIRPYAVVQLRRDNRAGSIYNLVGFQTHLAFPEQKRVFSLIPGLEKAEFVRYGVMHRNTYLNSPLLLDATYRLKKAPSLRFAGQMTGVEGYVESASSGLLCGLQTALELMGKKTIDFPTATAIGSLARYISTPGGTFTPMNANFGIIDGIERRFKSKKEKNLALSQRSLAIIGQIAGELDG